MPDKMQSESINDQSLLIRQEEIKLRGRRVFCGIGIAGMAVSFWYVYGGFYDVISGIWTGAQASHFYFWAIVFAAIGIGGGWLFRHNWKEMKAINDLSKVRSVLIEAKRSQGKVTALDITMHTSLSVADSKRLLSDLSAQGVCETEVTEGGQLLYLFHSFLPLQPAKIESTQVTDTEQV